MGPAARCRPGWDRGHGAGVDWVTRARVPAGPLSGPLCVRPIASARRSRLQEERRAIATGRMRPWPKASQLTNDCGASAMRTGIRAMGPSLGSVPVARSGKRLFAGGGGQWSGAEGGAGCPTTEKRRHPRGFSIPCCHHPARLGFPSNLQGERTYRRPQQQPTPTTPASRCHRATDSVRPSSWSRSRNPPPPTGFAPRWLPSGSPSPGWASARRWPPNSGQRWPGRSWPTGNSTWHRTRCSSGGTRSVFGIIRTSWPSEVRASSGGSGPKCSRSGRHRLTLAPSERELLRRALRIGEGLHGKLAGAQPALHEFAGRRTICPEKC